MDASNKQPTVAEKFAAVWEMKNAKAARAGGVSLMALSLAACGSSSTTTSTTSSTTTTTTTTTAADTIALTAGPNTVTGGAGDTTINALTEGHLEAGDTITGGAGNDTLVIRDYDSSAGTFTMSGVETIDINFATDALTLDLEDVTGVTNVKVDSAVTGATVANVESTMSLTLANIASGVTNIDVTFEDDEFAGTADTYSVTLDDVDDDLTLSLDAVGTDAEVIETLTINTGSNDNDAAITFDVEGQSATTVTITGSAKANLANLDGTTINAADATGAITLTNLSGTNMTITGGAGNDVIDMGTGLTVDDTIDGGAGTNTLILSTVTGAVLSTGSTGNVTNVSNIQTLRLDSEITAAAALSIDVSKLPSLTTINFDDYNDGNTDVHTITKMNDGMTIILDDSVNSNADTATDTDAELTLGFAANSSTNNVTLQLEGIQILKVNSADGYLDTMTIHSKDGTNVIEDASTLTAKTLIITGDTKLDMNTSNALATSVTTVDASAFTGILEITASTTGTEITGGTKADVITGGSGADVIVGGGGIDTINGAAGNDTIDGGAAADVITGGAGDDTITGGAGADDFVLDGLAASGTNQEKDIIKDFVAGTDDFDVNMTLVDDDTNDSAAGDAANHYVDVSAGATTTTFTGNGTAVIFEFSHANDLLGEGVTGTFDATTATGAELEAAVIEQLVTDVAVGQTAGNDAMHVLFIMYDESNNAVVVNFTDNTTNTDTLHADDFYEFTVLEGVTQGALTAADFV